MLQLNKAQGESLAGSREVEQTLRLARDEVERNIAKYRVRLFAGVVVVIALVNTQSASPTWVPTIFFGCVVVYALVIQAAVGRVGARPVITYTSLVCDLSLAPAAFAAVHYVSDNRENATFASNILGPALFGVVFINSLRYGRRLSVLAAVVAPVIYLVSMRLIVGFHPAQMVVATILGSAGLISLAATAQTRRSLDRFARLQLLRRYLPPAAVERVMREDPDASTAVGGKLVTVTVLSADLRGFTALSEKLGPQDVLEQLNAYHAVMIEVIERHNGAIDKFIGDGTLVVFGLEGDPDVAARAAVACARAMLVALEEHNVTRLSSGLEPLKMGIGVHTGAVIAGNIGVPGRRLEFTVIGDAVNTASRLEGQTKVAGTAVLVSGETVALMNDEAGLRELSPVSMRGKERTVRVFTLS